MVPRFKIGDVLTNIQEGFKVQVENYNAFSNRYTVKLIKRAVGLPEGYVYKISRDKAEANYKVKPRKPHQPYWF